MANTSRINAAPPAAAADALQRLGRNIRTARLRRKLRIEDVADRMGASRFTVADLEKGKPGTSMAAYAGALWALGLLEQMSELADEIRRASARPENDLHELFTRMCFNAAISNLDDHPRNHALLARDKAWRLSAAYDLTPMPVVAIDRRHLAMECGPAGRTANKSNILGAAGRFLLDSRDAESIFFRVTDTVRAAWHVTMRRAGVSEQDCDAIRSAFVYEGLFFDTAEKDS